MAGLPSKPEDILSKRVAKITLTEPMELSDVSLGLVGKNINGIHVLQLRDGTLNTVCPVGTDNKSGYVYKFREKDPLTGMMKYRETEADPETGARKMVIEHHNTRIDGAGDNHPDHIVKGAGLHKTSKTPDGILADPDDKKVWWMQNVHYEMKVRQEKEGVPIDFVEMPKADSEDCYVGTFEQFVDAVNARMGKGFEGKSIDLTSEQQRKAEEIAKKEAKLAEREDSVRVREDMAEETKKRMAKARGKYEKTTDKQGSGRK
jgi:hypothetical protein